MIKPKIKINLKKNINPPPEITVPKPSNPPPPPPEITVPKPSNPPETTVPKPSNPPPPETSILKPISEEQQVILDAVSQEKNVMVDAVAGSGKTTTNLYIAIHNPLKNILLLTYNAKLKLETRKKVVDLGLENMEVHSYHSFTVKHFYRKAFTDSGITAFLRLSNPAPLKSFDYQLVIVDEAQDMNPVYFELVLRLIKYLSQPPQLVIMGDRKQSIYEFNNADNRFLTMAPQIFDSPYPWARLSLTTSYRLTQEMASFINHCCRGAMPINAIKSGNLVKYLICDTYGRKPLQEIRYLLNTGYQNQDIFILAPSVRSEHSPARELANRLTRLGYPLYVPTTDEEKLDQDILVGKIVFSTFHQVKGLERPIVMVYGFDRNYYKYFAKDIPPDEYNQIPNTLYVAITRAQKQLIILHDEKTTYLDFVNLRQLRLHTQFLCPYGFVPPTEKIISKIKIPELEVTEMIKYVPVTVIDECMKMVTVTKTGQCETLNIPMKSQQEMGDHLLFEGVSEITGSAIPCYYQQKITGRMTLYDYLNSHKMIEINNMLKGCKCLLSTDDEDSRDSDSQMYDQWYEDIKNSEKPLRMSSSLLKLTTHWLCEKSGYDFKKKQITQYNWLKKDILDQAVERLDQLFSPDSHPHLEFEKLLIVRYNKYNIVGFADIYNCASDELWELKVVKEVDHSHILQVCIYAWMINHQKQQEIVKKIYLFNILNNLKYTIEIQTPEFEQVIQLLIQHKEKGLIRKSNEEFITKCRVLLEASQKDTA